MSIDVSKFESAIQLDPTVAARFVEVNQRLQSLSEILDQAVRSAIDQANKLKFDLEHESRALWDKTLGELGLDITSVNWSADIKDVNQAFIFRQDELNAAMQAEHLATFGAAPGNAPEPIDGSQTVPSGPDEQDGSALPGNGE